ncbi:ScbR family autoregulator-binding transcription factor [Streptomyces sp. NPDC059176]|uniref:ScbR family autoregulator-binding transcription factor n=1 Tax=unclassified Streptomyces TaxID=2593676 RepID=UPI0036A36EEB
MVQQERATQTRRQILGAAGEVFSEFGYEAATIAEILERAGVTRGALYFHFCSKEDLARGVLGEAVTLAGVRPCALKLQELVDAALLLAHRLPREPLLRAANRLALDVRARALLGTRWPEWIEVIHGLLVEAKARGETLPHIKPDEVARVLVGSWTGVQQLAEAVQVDRTLVEETCVLFRMLLPSVASPVVLAQLDLSADRPLGLVEPRPELPV